MPLVHGSAAAKLLRWAVDDPDTVLRYRAKVVSVPGSSCACWAAALSGRGDGRFWRCGVGGRDDVVIAHRFGFALEHGVDALLAVPVLGTVATTLVPTHRQSTCGPRANPTVDVEDSAAATPASRGQVR